jgi:alpha-glucosidase
MTTYPEPDNAIGSLTAAKTDGNVVELTASHSIPIKTRRLADTAWEIEVGYSTKYDSFPEHGFTGCQETLATAALSIEESSENIQISSAGETLTFNKHDASFSLSNDGKTLLSSCAKPFTMHPERVSLYEGIMSLKVTDFSERNPLGPTGSKYDTHMVRFQYQRPEGQVLGLPGQCGEFNRNGYRFELYNTDMFVHTPNRPPMYQSWPILMHKDESGSGWICVFHDNPTRTFVDVGDFYADRITFESVTGNTRLYILSGDSLADITRKLSTLLGPSVFPPAWAFGYQQCRWSYMSTDEVREVARAMRSSGIPCDSIYFDIDYMDGFRVFTTDPSHFNDLEECLADLHKDNFKAVCIVDPGVKVDEDYSVYTSLQELEAYLLTDDGKEFEGKVWPGQAVYPDFGDTSIRDAWGELQKDWLTKYPFDGIWNDMNEPSNFDGQNSTTKNALTRRGPLENEFNLYGYYMSKASAIGWEKRNPDTRGIVITRAGYPGVQQHSVIWHGDNQAWWEHLRLALDTAVTYSVCGAQYTGPDVPGFTGNPSDDLAIRFYQLGAFLPLFRGHSIYFAKDKEPYAFGEETQALLKNAIELRYSLLREWYTGYASALKKKTALMQPAIADGKAVRDQFLLFGKLLVAPVLERDQQQRAVYLPEGEWYRLGDTNKLLQGNQWLLEAVGLQSIPVFVKAGSILTRNTVGDTVATTFEKKENFEVYRDKDKKATGCYYSDDGISVNTSGKWEKLSLNENGEVIKEAC